MRKKKVEFKQVSIADARAEGKEAQPRSHLVAVDSDGRIWERFSDMPTGQWGQVEAPEDPNRSTARPRKK